MNRLLGHISKVNQYDNLSLIEVNVNNTLFKSIIIDDSNSKYTINQNVEVLFKATEVVISTESNQNISLQNQFNCQITEIKQGELLSDLTLNFGELPLHSIITTQSVKKLNLTVGQSITAMVKTNEIMIAQC